MNPNVNQGANPNAKRRVCVIGGGPAGLSAAIHAAASGADVTLLERNAQCGAKLLTTGGGRCNAANARPLAEWPPLFGKKGRFITPALAQMDASRLLAWFDALGQPLVLKDGFHYFPASNSAKAVRDALAAEAARLGVRMFFSQRVTEIVPILDGTSRKLAVACAPAAETTTEQCGEQEQYDKVILACGGKSYPKTGSTGDGAKLARALGHRVTPPVPGLVGLKTLDLDADLAGLVLPEAVVSFTGKGMRKGTQKAARGGATAGGTIPGKGELLLTHGGVSGPAILDLSASVNEALAEGEPATLRICWVAGHDQKWWLARFAEWRARNGGTALPALLKEFLPARLARRLCQKAQADTTAANLPARARDKLAEYLAAFPATISAHEGWDKAMITRGGVDLRDVNPKTLESTVTPGLFFAGETLDIDGPCGGYNLHWAFASGALAGVSA